MKRRSQRLLAVALFWIPVQLVIAQSPVFSESFDAIFPPLLPASWDSTGAGWSTGASSSGYVLDNLVHAGASRHIEQLNFPMPGVDRNTGSDRRDQGVIDAVDYLRVGFAASKRRVKYPYGEQEIRVLEPLKVIRHGRPWSFVPQRMQITAQAVGGVERGSVLNQPVREIGYRPRVWNIMALDRIPEQHGVQVLLMDISTPLPVRTDDFRKASGLPVLVEGFLNEKPSFCRAGPVPPIPL